MVRQGDMAHGPADLDDHAAGFVSEHAGVRVRNGAIPDRQVRMTEAAGEDVARGESNERHLVARVERRSVIPAYGRAQILSAHTVAAVDGDGLSCDE
jgi:hypothetical protein